MIEWHSPTVTKRDYCLIAHIVQKSSNDDKSSHGQLKT